VTATPKKIDKYDVVDVIGRGGMGVVYKAIDRALDRFVAIKMVTSADEGDGDLLKRFYREAQFTAKLRHQNIVTVYDLGEFSGKPYLVMEYLSGRSLDVMLAGPPISLQQRIHCIWQVCNGLHYAHSRQPSIIHRDIKPANIVVGEEGTAKIIDFGIARLGQSRNTRTGHIMGSYQYMSPEQINGSELDARTDIFSTGVVLYQTLTSRLPFEGSTISETLQNIMGAPPRPLLQFLKGYPARLDEVVTRALAKNREERYQSANEFAFDLLEIEEELKRGLFGSYLERAETLVRTGDYEQAKEELLQILEVDRQHARANELMHKVEQASTKEQRKSRAVHLQENAEEALKLNRLKEAVSYLDQAARLDPANAELRSFRERVAGMQARAERVSEILSRAERALRDEDFAEAQRAVREALRFDPESVRAKSFMGIVEAKLSGGRDLEGATSQKDQSWQDDPANKPTRGLEETVVGWPMMQKGSVEPIWSDTGASEVWSPDASDTDRSSASEIRRNGPMPTFGSNDATAGLPVFDAPVEAVPKNEDSFSARHEAGPSVDAAGVSERGEAAEPASPTTEAQSAANWPKDVLRAVEKQLAVFVGPLAKVIVKKAAARTRDADEFYNLLAAGIERESDRNAFLAGMRNQGTGCKDSGYQAVRAQVRQSLQNPAQDETLTPAVVQKAARLLGQYVGPLSGLFTKKAAQIADCERTLYILLAEHVPDSERDRFLQEAGISSV
jgi:serine/threonine protein kinase